MDSSIHSMEVDGSLQTPPFSLPQPTRKFFEIYELGDVLGEGGDAVVHMGINIYTGEKVAVKIAKRASLDPRKESAMKREFDILKSLKHPNVVKTIDLFEEDQSYFFVLEYMKGGELFDRVVKKMQYSEKEARDTIRCILSAVEYLHSHDIVHRDLKPENLLLESEDDDTSIKVADFGLAKTIEGNALISKAGTPEYWAPEILESKPCGKPVDMWAIGVISFVLLGGYTPFHSKDRSILYANICKADVKFHPKRWSAVSDAAKSFVRALLTYDSTRRMTVTEALQHPWIAANDEVLAQQNLTDNLEELKKFNSARKFHMGVQVITALTKLKHKARANLQSNATVSVDTTQSLTMSDSSSLTPETTSKNETFAFEAEKDSQRVG